jgi:hypothetical protein
VICSEKGPGKSTTGGKRKNEISLRRQKKN